MHRPSVVAEAEFKTEQEKKHALKIAKREAAAREREDRKRMVPLVSDDVVRVKGDDDDVMDKAGKGIIGIFDMLFKAVGLKTREDATSGKSFKKGLLSDEKEPEKEKTE